MLKCTWLRHAIVVSYFQRCSGYLLIVLEVSADTLGSGVSVVTLMRD